jgi:hypothetical protein
MTDATSRPAFADLRRELLTELMYVNSRADAEALLGAYRDLVAAAIVAGLAAIHDHSETAERNRPGLRMAMRNVHRFAETTPLTAAAATALEG